MTSLITFEEFKKIDIRVGEIKKVEKVVGAENLYKLSIDIGEKEITTLAGIAKFYREEDLLGKKVIVVTNLEPKKIKGIESSGMILAAESDEEIALLTVEKRIKNGSKVY